MIIAGKIAVKINNKNTV